MAEKTTPARWVDALIRLENAMADIYHSFSLHHIEDSAFWLRMQEEENKHAMVIRTRRQYIMDSTDLSALLLEENLPVFLKETVQVEDLAEKLHKNPTSRSKAFELAIEFEQSAGELHYKQTAPLKSSSIAVDAIRRLSDMDYITIFRIYGSTPGYTGFNYQ